MEMPRGKPARGRGSGGANYTNPPLTTVGVVKEHMGRRTMARLIELVEGVDRTVKVEVAPVRLIVRGSTAAPRAR
jgi:DNA-binding LacI/PurR family transcriptional regulator